ncbi:MAG: nuclear transport factor 2 family protein [Ferrovibrio sp.]
MSDATATLVQRYFDAFNARDTEACLSLLADDVVHDADDGTHETGKRAFRDFLERINRCYEEMVVDLFVTTSADGRQATAEFTLLGVYLETDDGLPEAEGQRFSRPAGAVFEIRHGKVARVSELAAPESDSRH